jgi:hypothetical protein
VVFRNRPRPTCERRCLREAFLLLDAKNGDKKAEFTKGDYVNLAGSLTINEFAIGRSLSVRVRVSWVKVCFGKSRALNWPFITVVLHGFCF